MNARLILIPIFLIGSCVAQVYEDIIKEIFNGKFQPQLSDQDLIEPNFETIEHPTTVGPKFVARVLNFSSYQPCGTNKVCVRQYLCKNGKVDQGGASIIEPRMGSGCKHGLEECCDISETLDEPILNSHPFTVGCGYRNQNGVGIKIKKPIGNKAEFGEFPWMVAISREATFINGKIISVYQCGGSLIAPTVVLTGAHCLQVWKASNFKVRAGEWETNTKTEIYPHQDRQVVEVIVHEHYNKGALYNDIALLILESPFEEAPNVNTVCLPPSNMNFDMSRCFATGWGKDQFQNGKYANILKKIDLPVVPNAKCQDNLRETRLGKFFKLHSSFMCAGGNRAGKDTCKGDGGSPLVCPMPNNPNRYFQAGIVSWGIGCGSENVPGVYANVSQLRSWIDEQLGSKRIDAKFFTP